MMNVPLANKTPVTVYSLVKGATESTYNRVFVERCHYQPATVMKNEAAGQVVEYDAKLLIYDMGVEIFESSVVVIGEIDFEFDLLPHNESTRQMIEFGKLHPTGNYKTVRVIPRVVGTPRMHHIAVYLKRNV
jgi:hypothetical protein